MSEIIPAILAKTKDEFFDKVSQVESFAQRVHLDIADGIFVPNTTIQSEVFASGDFALAMSVHLMVSKPENHVLRWLEVGADSISFHVEATEKPMEVINAVHEMDSQVGVVLNPATPVSEIESFIDTLDFVQFMTVQPGFYGGDFVESVIEKIKDFHYFYPDIIIAVDGGINPDTLGKLKEAGASSFIVGSYLFKDSDVEKRYRELESLL